MKNNEDFNILGGVENTAKAFDREVQRQARPIFRKYPLTFALLAIFGFSSVLYGLEGILDKISFFRDNPLAVLLFGLLLLAITGTLYKWLQNKEINIR